MSLLPHAKGWRHKIGSGAGRMAFPVAADAVAGWNSETFRDIQSRSGQARDRVASALGGLSHRVMASLDHNLDVLHDRIGGSSDVLFRTFAMGGSAPQVGLVYVDGLVDTDQLAVQVIKTLEQAGGSADTSGNGPSPADDLRVRITGRLMTTTDVRTMDSFDQLLDPLLAGDTVLFVDGCDAAFVIGLRQFAHRSVEQPATEAAIRAPREGFIEAIRVNTSLIRRRLNTSTLRVTNLYLGRRSKTEVAILYLQDVAAPELVAEVKRRVHAIDIDAIQESGYIEQFIEDNHFSPFPQVMNTERPDKVVANLLEGRVAILTDGTPFALIVPAAFSMYYQSVEDYYSRFLISSLVRAIRLLSLVSSLVFPSLYVSLVSFNPEMIPTKFAVAVAGGRAGVPVPAVVEVMMLEIVMEILREASLHLPRQIGGAISIVGVLVIGQAAVASGFVSPITVVIVAMTAIGSFATPAFDAASALRLLRFPLIIMAGIFGLYGVLVGLIFIVNHMLSLESFGVPYMAPVAPVSWRGLRDGIVRAPLWFMRRRPRSLQTLDSVRVANQLADVLDEKVPVLDPARGQGGERP